MLEKAKQKTATQKAAEKAEKAKARAEKLAAQKAATAQRHADAKSACKFGFYGVINDARTATPFAACKHFYLDMQNACGGAILRPLSHILGENKRDFAETYADKVKKAAKEKGKTKYTAFLVWGVLWQGLRAYTCGQMKADPETAQAVAVLADAMEKRQKAAKAARDAKAAAKLAKATGK